MATSRTSRQKKQARLEIISEEELLRLYEPFKFLEAEHWGETLVVAPDGRYLVGPKEGAVVHEAVSKFGDGLTVLKVGVVAPNWPWYREL